MNEDNYQLKAGIVKACAGIVESVTTEPYTSAVEQAGQVVGRSYAPEAEAARLRLLEAVKLNLINRKQYPIGLLRRKYNFIESEKQFQREKMRFCHAVAKRAGLI